MVKSEGVGFSSNLREVQWVGLERTVREWGVVF